MLAETLGHYRILRPLGKGGMGEVYAAQDTKLGRSVALKVLPQAVAADPARRERFEREARTVAALNHPNIVTVYSVEEAEGVPFLTMELIEGRRLSELIPTQGMTLDRFLQLAIPLADAVSAAHKRGIVHRDLKPANVMVTEEGQLKVLDFGLAKLKEAAHSGEELGSEVATWEQTGEGRIVGTAAYMSPEQAEGKPVDARSDVFSLGIVIYEMTTGRRPFQGDSAAGTLSSILKDTPVSVSELRPELPLEVGRIIRRCLEKDPARRMQTALDLRNELEDLKKDSDSGQVMRSTPALVQPAHPQSWKRRGLWIGALVVLALGGFAAWRMRPLQRAPAPPNRVAVTVFENRTGDASLDPIGLMAAERLVQGIAETGFVDVLPSAVVSREPAQMVSKATGAGTIVSGAYYEQADELQFQASITNARDGKLLFPLDPVKGSKASAAEVLEPLRQRVMGAIAVRFDSAVFFPHAKPPRYDAYRELTAGIDLWVTDQPQAETHYRRASEIEPEYFWAQMCLYFNRTNRGQYDEAEAVLRGVLPNRERLAPVERIWLDVMQADLSGKRTDEVQLLRRARDLAPSYPFMEHQLGIASLRVNRPRDLVESFGRADFQPWFKYRFGVTPFWLLAEAHHMLGNYSAELVDAQRGRQHYPDDLRLQRNEARALIALGRLDDLARVVEDSLSLPADPLRRRSGQIASLNPGDVLMSSAAELRAHGHKELALATARRAVAWVRARPPNAAGTPTIREALGQALLLADEWDDAHAVFAELAAKDAKDIEATGYLGVIAARKRDSAAVRAAAERLRRLTGRFLFGEHTRWRAAIAAQLDEKDEAVDLLREAFAQGRGYGTWLHRDPTLEPLRGYPPFEELVRPKK